jgi:hypothetical protein
MRPLVSNELLQCGLLGVFSEGPRDSVVFVGGSGTAYVIMAGNR